MIRLHYLQHVPFEDPGRILDWANAIGAAISSTRLDLGEPLPPLSDIDMLVVMGGPMNIYEDNRYPWLREEKSFIAQAIEQRKITLGICLGAQLISDVLGARVVKNRVKEIGWFPVTIAPEAHALPLFRQLPGSFPAFHWHGDTFEIPAGAQRIASSTACENQGFLLDNHVLGLQFHLESTRQGIKRLIANCQDELVAGEFIQPPFEMLAHPQNLQEDAQILQTLLDSMIELQKTSRL